MPRNGTFIHGSLWALLLMAGAGTAAADPLTDRVGEICTQAVASEFRNRGRADHFEDHCNAYSARVYVDSRDCFNCHVSKDVGHFTLFDMTGRQVAQGNLGGGERADRRGDGNRGQDGRYGDRGPDGRYGDRGPDGRYGERGRDGRFDDRRFSRGEIVVYERRGFHGESRQYQGEMRNLQEAGLNDAISSVRIVSGAWEFCSDADFRGRCVVLDRDEDNLADHGLGNEVSSFRPVRR